MQIKDIPRGYVRIALGSARLPLTVAERLAAHDADETWPPTLAFESFEAGVKQMVGSVLHDEVLLDEGRLTRAKVAELREAARLETIAQQRAAQADRTFEERHAADQRRLVEAEQRAESREEAAARRRDEKQAAADERARAKQAKARKTEAEREKKLERKERLAKVTAITKERDAIRHEKEAAGAQAEVIEVDKALEATRAARKNA